MSHAYLKLVAWRSAERPEGFPLNTYVNHSHEQEVDIWKQKGLLSPRGLGGPYGVHLEAFLPDYGLWRDLTQMPDRILRISPAVKTLIIRFADVPFCDGFGRALTKAEGPYDVNDVVWPPECEAQDIVIHGIGTRIVRVVFWRKEAAMPAEFALRTDQSTNIEPVLYDALTSRFRYEGEIDVWNIGCTSWWRLPREAPWELDRRFTTLCIRASEGVRFTPGLGWEITQLEQQFGREVAIGCDQE